MFKASLIGVPIPLCSCGVLPAAAGLKEQGAGKGAVSSFMISTPETGVDSIALTYALLDPLMTVLRPVTAFFSAIMTGVLVHFWGSEESEEPVPTSCCSSGDSCCAGEKVAVTRIERLRDGMRFAFVDLLDDIGSWLLFGVVLAGLIGVFLSPHLIETYLGDGLLSMLAMLVVATPLYVCAAASTPIAAALILKGLSPGAALVFLLAGPATNVATITVVTRLLGKRTTLIYVSSILVSSLLFGAGVSWIYGFTGFSMVGQQAGGVAESHGFIAYLSSVVLLALVLKGQYVKLKGRFHKTGRTEGVGIDRISLWMKP